MFLTALLCRGRIPGRQWIGKHRRPRTVSALAKQNMIRRLEIEAENHYWLSRPFLTAEHCLENPMDRGAWRATVHGVAKSWTQLIQCFGYLMRRASSLEKTLMLGKIEGRRRRA